MIRTSSSRMWLAWILLLRLPDVHALEPDLPSDGQQHAIRPAMHAGDLRGGGHMRSAAPSPLASLPYLELCPAAPRLHPLAPPALLLVLLRRHSAICLLAAARLLLLIGVCHGSADARCLTALVRSDDAVGGGVGGGPRIPAVWSRSVGPTLQGLAMGQVGPVHALPVLAAVQLAPHLPTPAPSDSGPAQSLPSLLTSPWLSAACAPLEAMGYYGMPAAKLPPGARSPLDEAPLPPYPPHHLAEQQPQDCRRPRGAAWLHGGSGGWHGVAG